jgi:hypothetical protein
VIKVCVHLAGKIKGIQNAWEHLNAYHCISPNENINEVAKKDQQHYGEVNNAIYLFISGAAIPFIKSVKATHD